MAFHHFRLAQAGPATAHWLRTNFERVSRTPEDIRQDYLRLLWQVRATTGARLLVLNLNATPAHEFVRSYAGTGMPMSRTMAGVWAKELNLMLHELSRDHALDVVDTDSLGARLGLRDNMPDGTHHSGRLQAALRGEILQILRDRGVPGFGARTPTISRW